MKSKKIVSLALASAVLATGAFSPFSAQAQDPAVIRIYSSLPLTGSSAGQTTTLVNAMKLAIDQKTKGGLVCDGKFKIDYVSLDDATAAKGAWDAAKEQENANKAVADADAMVYLGTFNSGAAKVSIPILNQANLVMISPANTYEGLTKKTSTTAEGDPDKYYPTGKRNYTRVVVADDVQGNVAAKWAKNLRAKSVFILHDTEAYGKGVADVFRATAKSIGLTEVGYEGIDGKAADYSALATKIQSAKADLIYYGGITQNNAGQLVKDIRKAGIRAIFMGPDGIFEEAFIKAAGEAANGVYVTAAGLPENQLPAAGRKFYADYRRIYKGEPETYTVYGYEAMSVALAAISKACAKDRVAILDAVLGTKNFRGVLGTWSFDANGDVNLSSISGAQVVRGKFGTKRVLRFP
jgi:branched-chain amino acid transport system substrate-binding protein